MTLPRSIPIRPCNGFPFLGEIDFVEYRRRLAKFVDEDGYAPTAPDHPMIPRVVGFLDEMEAAQEILTSSQTDSVYVVGDEGVGKSALVLGFVNKAAAGELSPALLTKCWFIFDIHSFFKLPAAEQVSAFDAAMDYLQKKDSLVIIDRIDDFIAGCGEDRARRLVGCCLIDALENDRVSAIVTAQPQNHAAVVSTSTLFLSCFEQLKVGERDADDARDILRQMAPTLEQRHRVVIGEDVVAEVVRLDQRYEGRLEGKSPSRLIEFLDRLAASVNIAKYGKPVELMRQELTLAALLAEQATLKSSLRPSSRKINEVGEKIAALRAVVQPQVDAWKTKFGEIRQARLDLIEARAALAPLQDKADKWQAQKEKDAERRARGEPPAGGDAEPLTSDETRMRDSFAKAEKALCKQLHDLESTVYAEVPHVTVGDVRAKFTKATGAGGAAVLDEEQRLLGLEKVLGKNVFGQDAGIRALANAYRMREAGTSDPTRPAAVVLLLGSTGCGKTEVVERLAAFDGTPLIDYNMGEFIDKSAVSNLMGAAAGLVGWGQTKTLPSAVREQPKSILFLDEFEKAHPDMQKPLMQINDKGKAKDEFGNSVSFKDCIVVMASNVLTASDFAPGEIGDDKIVRAKLLAKINPGTGHPYFLPEVVGRIDKVVVFNDVTPGLARDILFKNVRDINAGIAAKGYVLELGDRDADRIVATYFDPSQGGRSIKQFSNNVLRPLVTERLLARKAAEAPAEDDDVLRPMTITVEADGAVMIDGKSTLEQAA